MPGSEKFATLSLEDQIYRVKELTRDIVDDFPGGRKALAHDLRTSYITLSRWCNEYLDGHCIPPHMTIGLYHKHPDPRLVQFICRNTNHLAVLVPEPLAEFPEIAQAVGATSKEFGDLLQEIGKTLSKEGAGGSSITPGELEKVRKEAHEAMAAIAALLKAVEILSKDRS